MSAPIACPFCGEMPEFNHRGYGRCRNRICPAGKELTHIDTWNTRSPHPQLSSEDRAARSGGGAPTYYLNRAQMVREIAEAIIESMPVDLCREDANVCARGLLDRFTISDPRVDKGIYTRGGESALSSAEQEIAEIAAEFEGVEIPFHLHKHIRRLIAIARAALAQKGVQ